MNRQVPDVDYIVVPVGGAGLIAGISLATKTLQPEVKVRFTTKYSTLVVVLRMECIDTLSVAILY